MQQNQYDPSALSHQAAVVTVISLSPHMLLENTHDASRNIFSMYRQKTSNQFSVPSLRLKLHPLDVTFLKGAWRAHEMAYFGDPYHTFSPVRKTLENSTFEIIVHSNLHAEAGC